MDLFCKSSLGVGYSSNSLGDWSGNSGEKAGTHSNHPKLTETGLDCPALDTGGLLLRMSITSSTQYQGFPMDLRSRIPIRILFATAI